MNRKLISALTSRFRRRRPEPAAIWSGVYPAFDAIPRAGSPYQSSAALAAAEALLEETDRDPMPREAAIDHEVLALVARLAGTSEVRVVDFGGGVGQSYAALRRMVAPELALRYRIVDLDEVVRRGRGLWSGNGEIEFSEEMPGADFAPEVIFTKGVIQYIEDYRALLRAWFSIGPRWVSLEKLPVVTSPMYATMQLDVYGTALPYWMFNIADLAPVAREAGYRIALQRRLERVYDQSDFPAELRMSRATSLLFERA